MARDQPEVLYNDLLYSDMNTRKVVGIILFVVDKTYIH